MDKISRSKIADFINVTPKEATPTYKYMNKGFNTLNENPGAQIDKKTYIGDTTATSSVKGYETVFPYDCDFIKDEVASKYLYDIGRNHAIGDDAETDFIKVDMYDPCFVGSTQFFKARKFRVCIEVSGAAGAGGETIVSTGNLNTVGNPIFGYWDTVAKEFTEGEYTESLGVLTVTSAAGATSGKTTITVASTLTSGNIYMYKTATVVTAPLLDTDLSSTYTLWNGSSEILATTGDKIGIVEVNSSFLAKKFGVATVTSKV